MKYILDEEEYQKLVSAAVPKAANMVTNEDLQKATDSFVANLEGHLRSLEVRARHSGNIEPSSVQTFVEAVRSELHYFRTAAKLK